MGEQQSTSRLPITLSAIAVLVAAVGFGAAFYYYDGVTVIRDVFASVVPSSGEEPSLPTAVKPSSEEATLTASIPQDFALRLWQEQVDSSVMIGKLVDGEIESLEISRVESSSAEATMHVSVALKDEGGVEGVIGLTRFGDEWYVSFASLERDGDISPPGGPLPSIDDVDVELLNTMFDEQAEYQGVFDEYVSGTVSSVTLKTPQPGPNTVSIDAVMHETHGKATAQLVAVQSEFKGRPYWFITRFEKTGHSPPE